MSATSKCSESTSWGSSARLRNFAACGCHRYWFRLRRSKPLTVSVRNESSAARTTTRPGTHTASGAARFVPTWSMADRRPKPRHEWSIRSVITTLHRSVTFASFFFDADESSQESAALGSGLGTTLHISSFWSIRTMEGWTRGFSLMHCLAMR